MDTQRMIDRRNLIQNADHMGIWCSITDDGKTFTIRLETGEVETAPGYVEALNILRAYATDNAYSHEPKMYGRLNNDGSVSVLYEASGEPVTRLDHTVYPVGSLLSARYEHARGIVLTEQDARKIGLDIDDSACQPAAWQENGWTP